MINLLPPNEKRELRAGRANRLLLRYLLLFLALAVVMLAILLGAYLLLNNTKDTAEAQKIEISQSMNELQSEQQQVQAFNQDLAVARQILDRQINYSWIVLRFAESIPDGVIIDQMTLDPESLGAPTKINASAKSLRALLAFKDQLNNSTYFSDASFDTVSRQEESYPLSTVINVTVRPELLTGVQSAEAPNV